VVAERGERKWVSAKDESTGSFTGGWPESLLGRDVLPITPNALKELYKPLRREMARSAKLQQKSSKTVL
jgi:hypothetical protein